MTRLLIAGVIALIIFIMMSALKVKIEAKKAETAVCYSSPKQSALPDNGNSVHYFSDSEAGWSMFSPERHHFPRIFRHPEYSNTEIPLSGKLTYESRH